MALRISRSLGVSMMEKSTECVEFGIMSDGEIFVDNFGLCVCVCVCMCVCVVCVLFSFYNSFSQFLYFFSSPFSKIVGLLGEG